MLWVVFNRTSHQIISCNMFTDEEKNIHQLWIERPNGKTLKIVESDNINDVKEVKDAIDYAIKTGEPTLELS